MLLYKVQNMHLELTSFFVFGISYIDASPIKDTVIFAVIPCALGQLFKGFRQIQWILYFAILAVFFHSFITSSTPYSIE